MTTKATKDARIKERGSIRERICHALDVSPDAFCNDVLVELRGRNRVRIEGKLRILSYTPSKISLQTARGKFSIVGKRLFCSVYSQGCVLVDGYVVSLGFEEER